MTERHNEEVPRSLTRVFAERVNLFRLFSDFEWYDFPAYRPKPTNLNNN